LKDITGVSPTVKSSVERLMCELLRHNVEVTITRKEDLGSSAKSPEGWSNPMILSHRGPEVTSSNNQFIDAHELVVNKGSNSPDVKDKSYDRKSIAKTGITRQTSKNEDPRAIDAHNTIMETCKRRNIQNQNKPKIIFSFEPHLAGKDGWTKDHTLMIKRFLSSHADCSIRNCRCISVLKVRQSDGGKSIMLGYRISTVLQLRPSTTKQIDLVIIDASHIRWLDQVRLSKSLRVFLLKHEIQELMYQFYEGQSRGQWKILDLKKGR
jgi:hypothetical protein